MLFKWCLILLSASFWTVQGGFSPCIEYVSRRAWGALRPKAVEYQSVPIKTVIIAHTAGNSCSSFDSCSKQLRNIQDYHMGHNNYDDIGYNFLVGGDGNIYEGRNFDKVGAHSKGHNRGTVAIAFMGLFTDELPPVKALASTMRFLDCAVQANLLDPNYKLFGHRQVIPTESPGRRLYAELQYWSHWSASFPN